VRAEVRCCCDPGQLLGTIDVDVPYLYEGQVFRFFVGPSVSLRPYWEQRDDDLFITEAGEQLTLTVARVQGRVLGTGEVLDGLAIKSNDTPIEKLRRINGFQEAKERR
jgi:hypothetical protein